MPFDQDKPETKIKNLERKVEELEKKIKALEQDIITRLIRLEGKIR